MNTLTIDQAGTPETTFEAPQAPSKAKLWTGRIMTGLPLLFLAWGGVMKLIASPEVVEASARIGYERSTLPFLGTIELSRSSSSAFTAHACSEPCSSAPTSAGPWRPTCSWAIRCSVTRCSRFTSLRSSGAASTCATNEFVRSLRSETEGDDDAIHDHAQDDRRDGER